MALIPLAYFAGLYQLRGDDNEIVPNLATGAPEISEDGLKFAARMLDPEESQRVKALAYELALEHGLDLSQWSDQLTPNMPPSYVFDAEGKLQRA